MKIFNADNGSSNSYDLFKNTIKRTIKQENGVIFVYCSDIDYKPCYLGSCSNCLIAKKSLKMKKVLLRE